MAFNLVVVLVVTLSAVQAAVVRPEDVARLLPEARANTLISVVTTTAVGPTTVTKQARLVCATLEAAISTTACRRKRQFWNAPLFFALGQDDVNQFETLNPTQVLQVEPSALPSLVEYRNRPVFRPYVSQQFNSPFAVQSSLSNKVQPLAVRVADPFFGAARFSALSSLFAGIVSNVLTPLVTSTSTKTVYTTTTTSTTFTSTATYTIKNALCVPKGVKLCPADPSTTTPGTTTTSTSETTTTTGTTSTTGASTTTDATTTTTDASTTTTDASTTTDSTTTTTTDSTTTTTTDSTTTTTTEATGGGF